MSEYTEIKERINNAEKISYTTCNPWLLPSGYRVDDATDEIKSLIDIIEKKDEAINELLINIELSHPEEYKQYRELPAVDEAYKLTEE